MGNSAPRTRQRLKHTSKSEPQLPVLINTQEAVRTSNLERLLTLKNQKNRRSNHLSMVFPVETSKEERPSPSVNTLFQGELFNTSQIQSIVGKHLLSKGAKKESRFAHRFQIISTSEAPNAFVQLRVKTTRERREIKAVLSSHFLFKSLSDESIETVIDKMKHFSLSPRDVVFNQGSVGHYFFIVASGHVEVVINNRRKHYLSKGKCFGELALLQDSIRSATIRSVDRSTLWGIERSDFRLAIKTVNSLLYDQNKKFLDTVPLLAKLTPMQKDNLITVLVTQEFKNGDVIIREGDSGDLFYIVKEGTVLCTRGGKYIREMHEREFFGEQALIYNTKRTATITAKSNVTLLSLVRSDLVRVLGNQLMSIIFKNTQRISLDASPVFTHLSSNQVEKVIDKMRIVTYKTGETMIKHGYPKGQKIWIVLHGIIITSGFDKECYDFEIIGDLEFNNNKVIYYSEDYIAAQDTSVAEITKEEIEKILGFPINDLSASHSVLNVIKKITIFRALPTSKLERLILAISTRSFRDGRSIVSEGEPGHEFFIVKEGEIDVFRDNKLMRSLGTNAWFGERSILFNEKRTATVKANGKVVCWVLSRKEFLNLIDENMRKQLIDRIKLQNDAVRLTDLTTKKELGGNGFSTVRLCYCQSNDSDYVLKSFDIDKIEEMNLQESLVSQKEILKSIDHPLIMKLVKTFKEGQTVYFLQEYIDGLPMSDVLAKLGLLSTPRAKFYTSCLLLILEHLHERKIVYRDLKPENIVVDRTGYPKLIDFDTAKVIDGRTYTVIGTPHYLAPEIIGGNGYGLAADYWSLGIILYEFIYGMVPFGSNEDDPLKIFQIITEQEMLFPNRNDAIDLIQQLTDRIPAKRGDYTNIKKHDWFRKFNWDWIFTLAVKPPYIPDERDYKAQNSLRRLKKKTTRKYVEKTYRKAAVEWDNF